MHPAIQEDSFFTPRHQHSFGSLLTLHGSPSCSFQGVDHHFSGLFRPISHGHNYHKAGGVGSIETLKLQNQLRSVKS